MLSIKIEGQRMKLCDLFIFPTSETCLRIRFEERPVIFDFDILSFAKLEEKSIIVFHDEASTSIKIADQIGFDGMN